MKREDKNTIIDSIAEMISNNNHFYLTDIGGLNAEDTSNLRRACYNKNIKLLVVKNTLLIKALGREEGKYDELFDSIKGSTSIMFTEVGNAPAKLIQEFRKGKKHGKPVLRSAYVEESIYVGDNMLDALSSIKSREELIGDIVLLLQSPMKNVMSSLQSGGNILHGVLETLANKE